MTKEKLIVINYELKAVKAIQECETTKLTFNRWLRHYGLYCSGKEFNTLCETLEKDYRVDTTLLGQALYNAQMGKITKYEAELVELSRESIGADLVLDNLGPKLNLTK